MERIHIDYAGPFLNKMFLVVVKAHSKWPEVIQMSSTTSQNTIEALRPILFMVELIQVDVAKVRNKLASSLAP